MNNIYDSIIFYIVVTLPVLLIVVYISHRIDNERVIKQNYHELISHVGPQTNIPWFDIYKNSGTRSDEFVGKNKFVLVNEHEMKLYDGDLSLNATITNDTNNTNSVSSGWYIIIPKYNCNNTSIEFYKIDKAYIDNYIDKNNELE